MRDSMISWKWPEPSSDPAQTRTPVHHDLGLIIQPHLLNNLPQLVERIRQPVRGTSQTYFVLSKSRSFTKGRWVQCWTLRSLQLTGEKRDERIYP